MMISNRDKNEKITTTIRISRRTYESAKIMAILTRSSVSKIMDIALIEKIKQLKEKGASQ